MPQPNSENYAALIESCRQTIAVGSKSFSLAAKIFGKEKKDGAFLLYRWCRYCDDAIDEAADQSPENLQACLAELREKTESAFSSRVLHDPIFRAFQLIVHHYEIPPHYPFELLNGMEMDITKKEYQNFDELLLYSYRVASCVGLMMSHIMGLKSDSALRNASDLGTAMQLTNISRDVFTDARLGRVYLPQDWLAEEKVASPEIESLEKRAEVVRVVGRLLKHADQYYQSGEQGLSALSFRSACTIVAASRIYREIGVLVKERGPKAWDTRAVVPLHRKLRVLAWGLLKVFMQLPARLFRPWRPVRLRNIFEFSGSCLTP